MLRITTLILLLLLTAACGASVSSQEAASVAPGASTSRQPSLFFIEGGILTPIENGAQLPLNKGLSAEVFVNPYPPAPDTDLDLYLVRAKTREPVTDARVTFRYQMQFMDHGIWERQAISSGDGHYLAPMNLFMLGEWLVELLIQAPEGTVRTSLGLAVYPR